MTMDTAGRNYVVSDTGIQVLDQLGRVHLILKNPSEDSLSNVVFGGSNGDRLFVTSGTVMFSRKLKARGAIPWKGAVKPPDPQL
tara:strand:- start:9 stop:260 length:252 start_codon:yes stop_codon:yes gene_type:complete